MKISEMSPLTSGETGDVFPVVRSATNFKMTLSTLMNFIIEKLGGKIGDLANIDQDEAAGSDSVAINHSGETRKMNLTSIGNWILLNVMRPRWCCGTFSCDGESDLTITFPRELRATPIVVCTPVGNTTANIYSIKVKPNTISTTGFQALVLQQHDGTTSRSDSASLVINYIAWCTS